MTASRFPNAPPQIAALPVEARGYPVPYFVETIDGEPDFRVVDPRRMERCHKLRLCWTCGRKLGGVLAFVLGPMCAITRTNPEPPSHPDCARFAATACPFLTRPLAKRRDLDRMRLTHNAPAGIGLARNPGCVGVWLTRSYRTVREGDGMLFKIGTPIAVEWLAEGRPASRREVVASIESGYPMLLALAEEDGPEAVALLQTMASRALAYLPRF